MTSVIDADGHVEPALVADWRELVGGEVGRRVHDNARRWFDLVGHGSSTQAGAWDPVARLRDLDRDGIDVSVLFGSSKGPACIAGGDADLEPVIARAFNDWLADYCAADPSRLKAAAWIALHDIPAACAEATRAVTELGAVGVVINPCGADTSLDDAALFPLYETLERLDTPALVHGTGSVGDFLAHRYHTHMQRHAIAFPLSLQMATLDLVAGGVLERFHRLRVGLFEGGAGWVPWWLDRLDEHCEFAPYAAPFIADKPTRLVDRYIAERRLFWSCEPDEAHLGYAAQCLGSQALMFASDYPHWDCTFPGAVAKLANRTDLDTTARQRILHGNAAEFYGLS